MRSNTSLTQIILMVSASFMLYSCQKSLEIQENNKQVSAVANSSNASIAGMNPYQFERINEHNFSSQGWREQQINSAPGGGTVSIHESEFMQIVCGPEDNSDPRLGKGCITMNLPSSLNPTLRRIRLRKGGYSGTRLADLTEFKYSTYVVHNAPTNLVLQIDVTGDGVSDLNIWIDPRAEYQEDSNFPPVVLNTWQQWDMLQGTWHAEFATIGGVPEYFTIGELAAIFPDARIVDRIVNGTIEEGIRFTLGPVSLFANTVGYLDGLIIGTRDKQVSTVFDFICSQ